MKKILLFIFLLPTLAFAQLELPFPIKLVNPKPVDFWYFESDGTPYDNTGEVISQVLSAIRYRGMTFNVNGVEYWFKDGITDGDLIAKGGSSLTLVDGNGTTVNGTGDGVDLGGTLTAPISWTTDNQGIFMTDAGDGGTHGQTDFGFGGGVGFFTQSKDPFTATNFADFSIIGNVINFSTKTSSGTQSGSFVLQNATATYTDTKTTKDGIKYGASGYVTDTRSLTDKGYVDAAISTAGAGYMTLTGTQALTGNKIIGGSGSGYSFNIGDFGSEVGDFKAYTSGEGRLQSTGTYGGIVVASSSPTDTRISSGPYAVNPQVDAGLGPGDGLVRMHSNGSAGRFVIGKAPSINSGNPYVILDLTPSSDATGDIYYRNSSGFLSRLAAGTNGHVLTLAAGIPSWAAPSGGSGLTVGTSTITSGTNTKVLYNNSGVLGEYTVSGTGNVALTTSPTFTTPNIGTATGTASGDVHLTGTSTLTGNVNIAQAGFSTTFSGIGKVTFNPTSGRAGINVGSYAGNVIGSVSGDFWYNSTDDYLGSNIAGNPRMILSQNYTGSTNNTIPYFTTGSRGVVSASTSLQFNGTSFMVGAGTLSGTIRTLIRGIGTGTNYSLKLETSGGTERFGFLDNGSFLIGGSAGTSGQVLTSAGSGSPPTWSAAGDVVGPSSSVSDRLAIFSGTSGKLLKADAIGFTSPDLIFYTTSDPSIYPTGATPSLNLTIRGGNGLAPNNDGGSLNLSSGAPIGTGVETSVNIQTRSAGKIGFFNTTAIVQPTTGITAATFTANTSLIANDTATFDGYTIGQIVKALRNLGILQ